METPQVVSQEDPIRPLIQSAKGCIENGQYAEAMEYLDGILRTPFEKKDSSQNFVENIDNAIHLIKLLAEKVNYPKTAEIAAAIEKAEQTFTAIFQNQELTEEQANAQREEACIEASNAIIPYIHEIKDCQNKQSKGVCVPAIALAGLGAAAVAAGVVFFLRKRRN